DHCLRHTSAHGRVSVSSRLARDVEIAVSNTGPAIPRSRCAQIFSTIAVADESGAARGNAGLALYLCKRAVEALGGHIEVIDTQEWPTSFIVRLPAP
ncbi:MAG: ATP-binding protein, partial [Myxococcota bacterium]|nr:ATP-binding protein [Myxococcota bacterium]